MLSEEDKQLLNNFATVIFYKDKENYYTFDFVTACDYICKNTTPYFDLLKNKPLKKLPKNIDRVVALGVPTDLALFKFYEADKETKENFYKDYFKNIESSIFTTLQIEKEELNNKVLIWKNSTLDELLYFAEEEYDLKFSTKETKQAIIKKLKKKFLKLLRDEIPYNVRRLLNIFELQNESNLYITDQKIINSCKVKWLSILNNRKEFTYKLLEKENQDPETLEEINQIKKEIDESIESFRNKIFETPIEVSSYWPIILYPRPLFSLELINETINETKQENLSSNIP